jgi:two-component system phosphate regulon response regulator OmpR
MPDVPTILIVDDEPEVREMLDEYLRKRGFAVFTADGGEALRHVVAEREVDVVLLDRRMPGEDGLSLAQFLHTHYPVGIIMLTAADEVTDRIAGLQMGADDYLTKPCDPRELLARIHSLMRRMRATAPARPATGAVSPAQRVRFGCGILDFAAHRLYTLEGDEIPLAGMELALLQAFATYPNQVLSRDQLLEIAHPHGWEHFDRSIDVRIARLRRKIEVDPEHPRTIRTVRGAGYMFVPHEGA